MENMEYKKHLGGFDRIKQKKGLLVMAALIIAAGVGCGVWAFQNTKTAPETMVKEQVVTRGSIISSLTEDSTASVSTETTALDLNVTLEDSTLDLDVEVEEILVRAGEQVQAGDPLFIISQESMNKVKNTLNNAYQEAQLKADEAVLNLKLGTLEAEQKMNQNVGNGAVAGTIYENTLIEMNNKLAQYEKNLSEAEEDYAKSVELLDLYNLRLMTKISLEDTLTEYEESLESLKEFYDDYNEENSEYLDTYRNYEKQMDQLVAQLNEAKELYAQVSNIENPDEEIQKLQKQYGDAYWTAADKFDKALEIINKYSSVIEQYDTLETRMEEAEDCLAEAKEAYDDYNADFQDWYGNMTCEDLERKVEQMAIDLENTRLTYENYKLNFETNQNNAESTKTKAELTAETAELTYQSTMNNLQQKVLSTQQDAENMYAYVKELNSCLKDNVILSPCDGLVTNIAFAEGDKINLTRSVITIAKTDKLTVSLSIDQDDITNVALDQQALVTFDTNRKTYEGYVNAISVSPAMMGSPTVTYTVTVLVEGEGMEDIYEGMSCTVDLVAGRVDDVLVVPKRAITTEGKKNYVMVKQEDGSSVKQEVTLGFTDGSDYEVKEGLNEGDIILIGSAINNTGGVSSAAIADKTGEAMTEESKRGNLPSDMSDETMPNFEGGMPGGTPRNS